jgi:septum formation protein
MSRPVILASASPRRKELLATLQVPFRVVPANVPEVPDPEEAVQEYVLRLAAAKAAVVAERFRDALVVAADTEVELDGAVLGKPSSPDHAVAMLRQLSGRTHRVCTGVCLRQDQAVLELFSVETLVTFKPLSDEAIAAYVASGEPMDKAGAYGAQGEGRRLIERIEGSWTNVIGLPLEEVAACLRRHGVLGSRVAESLRA